MPALALRSRPASLPGAGRESTVMRSSKKYTFLLDDIAPLRPVWALNSSVRLDNRQTICGKRIRQQTCRLRAFKITATGPCRGRIHSCRAPACKVFKHLPLSKHGRWYGSSACLAANLIANHFCQRVDQVRHFHFLVSTHRHRANCSRTALPGANIGSLSLISITAHAHQAWHHYFFQASLQARSWS